MSDNQYLNKEGLNKYHEGVVGALDGKASKNNGIYYVKGNSTVAGKWTGTLTGLTSYYDGLTILYKINVTGLGSNACITLNLNDLGEKHVLRYSNIHLTNQFKVDSTIMLSYIESEGCWFVTGDNSLNDSEAISNADIDAMMED